MRMGEGAMMGGGRTIRGGGRYEWKVDGAVSYQRMIEVIGRYEVEGSWDDARTLSGMFNLISKFLGVS